jgi:hypothetical protein
MHTSLKYPVVNYRKKETKDILTLFKKMKEKELYIGRLSEGPIAFLPGLGLNALLTESSTHTIQTLYGVEIYPPSQKATPACHNALRRAGTGFKTVDECEGGYPSKLIRSVVGYASEGSALRSMWRSHGL